MSERKEVTDDQLMVDMLEDVVGALTSAQRTRRMLADALMAPTPEQCRRVVAEARHQLATTLQGLYWAVDLANEICRRNGWPTTEPPPSTNGK